MALIVQPCLRNASASTTNSHASILRRGPFQQLPDSDTREPGRGPPTTGGSQTASRLGVVIFDEQDWSLSDERRHQCGCPGLGHRSCRRASRKGVEAQEWLLLGMEAFRETNTGAAVCETKRKQPGQTHR